MVRRQQTIHSTLALLLLAACGGATEPGAAPPPPPPPAPPPAPSFSAVSAGHEFTCAVGDGGQAFCWGTNASGELGTDSGATNETAAVAIAGDLRLRTISAGSGYACGTTTDDEAYCWGRNDLNQLGIGGSSDNQNIPTPVAGGVAFDVVRAGVIVTCGLDTSGAAHCWGLNTLGQAGRSSPAEITEPLVVEGSETFVSLDIGGNHACGAASDGDGFCWGANATGELGTGNTSIPQRQPTPVAGGLKFQLVTVALDAAHSCGLTPQGEGFCWGWNNRGQLGDGTTTNRAAPTAVSGGLLFQSLDAGQFHTCGVATDGQAYCWGWNGDGQLGDGSTTDRSTPVQVATDIRFESISAGLIHTCGVSVDEEIWCWGDGGDGQLGNDDTQDSSVPVRVVVRE